MKLIHILLFTIVTSSCYAQAAKTATTTNKLTRADIERAKILYLPWVKSEEYKKSQKISVEVYPLLNGIGFQKYKMDGDNSKPEKIYAWVRAHAPKEKAALIVSKLNEIAKLNDALYKSHAELYEYLRLANKEQLKEIAAQSN